MPRKVARSPLLWQGGGRFAPAVLGRKPTAGEVQSVEGALAGAKEEKRAVVEDVLWALMSSREFIFNH